jgi:hypothetical protein
MDCTPVHAWRGSGKPQNCKDVGFGVLTAVPIKRASSSLVQISRSFERTQCLHLQSRRGIHASNQQETDDKQSNLDAKDGGIMYLRSVGEHPGLSPGP